MQKKIFELYLLEIISYLLKFSNISKLQQKPMKAARGKLQMHSHNSFLCSNCYSEIF